MATLCANNICVWIPKLVLLSTLLLGWMRCVAAVGGSKSFALNDHLATKASSCMVGSLSTSKLRLHPHFTLSAGSTNHWRPQSDIGTALDQHSSSLRVAYTHMT
jgi:hypothetical protein